MDKMHSILLRCTCTLFFFVSTTFLSFSQTSDLSNFISSFSKKSSKGFVKIKINSSLDLEIKVNINSRKEGIQQVVGSVNGHTASLFSFEGNQTNGIKGELLLPLTKKAFKITTKDGKVNFEEIDINKIMCITPASSDLQKTRTTGTTKKSPPNIDLTLESFPNANGTIFLDFDGHLVHSRKWNGGEPFTADPANFSDAIALACWRTVSEDFRPFNVNVTTNEDVFNATPTNRRSRVIYTPTDSPLPGSGGAGFVGTFGEQEDSPCFVFQRGIADTPETGSHEAGHTLGLVHDGGYMSQYYRGHQNWGPIMGSTFITKVNQWSKGEYSYANNYEDDVAIIASSRFGLGFRDDAHSDEYNLGTPLQFVQNGTLPAQLNKGIIEQRTDVDVFKLNTIGGPIEIYANPDPFYPNLNIQLRLLDENGNELMKSDPLGLSAVIDTTLSAGIYHLEVDGVGYNDPISTGYSDYGSLGYYELSGSFAASNDPFPPAANFSFNRTTICTGEDIQFSDFSIGNPSTFEWVFEGGTPSTSSELNPLVTYDTPGKYSVTLSVSNSEGSDVRIENKRIQVGQTSPLPFVESFEGDFPPILWSINNFDNSLAFEKSELTGYNSTSCMLMNNADNSVVGEIDEIELAPVNLEESSKAYLTFNLAYTKFDDVSPDELRVFIADKCHPEVNDWTEIFHETHLEMQTVEISSGASNAWIPSSPGDWKTVEIDLSSYVGNSYIQLKLQNTSGYGTKIWLDNFNISSVLESSTTPPSRSNIFPNPATNQVTIQLSELEIGKRAQLDIRNSIGQLMLHKTLVSKNSVIDVSSFASGIYFLHLKNDYFSETKKIVIK